MFNGAPLFEQGTIWDMFLHYFSCDLFIFFHDFLMVNTGKGLLKGGRTC